MSGITGKRRGVSADEVNALIGNNLSDATPEDIASSGSAGTDTESARGDHEHGHGIFSSGDLHTEYQQESEKGQVDGYAALDGAGQVPAAQAPAKSVYATGGAQALTPTDIGAEAIANKAAANGYAPLDGASRVPPANAPAKAVYTTGGGQAIVASEVQAAPEYDAHVEGSVTTNDATPTVVATLPILDGKTLMMTVIVSAHRAAGPEGAGFVRHATYRRTGGTVTQIGAITSSHTAKDNGAWLINLVINGTNVEIQVTGVTTNTNWTCRVQAQEA